MKVDTKGRDTDLYSFASLDGYGFLNRLLIHLADLGIYTLASLIGWSIRFEEPRVYPGREANETDSFEHAFEKKLPAVIAFWHDRILLTTYFFRNYDAVVMISKSRDGEYMSRIAQRFGYGVVRGSSSRGGTTALVKMMKLAKDGIRLGLTVDGPRGPRHKVKKGVIVLARDAGIPIIPAFAEADKVWKLKNWDKTRIPRPFSRAVVIVGEPILVPKDADAAMLEDKRLHLERSLDELAGRAKE